MRSNNIESRINASNDRRFDHGVKDSKIPSKDSLGISRIFVKKGYGSDIADIAGILDEINHEERGPGLSSKYDGFDMFVARLSKVFKWLLPPAVAISACTVAPESSPIVETAPVPDGGSFAMFFNRDTVKDHQELIQLEETVNLQLDSIEAQCKQDFGGTVVDGSEFYIFLNDADTNIASSWEICSVIDAKDGKKKVMVSRYNSVDNTEDRLINQQLMVFTDTNDVGYIDVNGKRVIIFKNAGDGKYGIQNIKGKMVVEADGTSEPLTWLDKFMNIGVTPVSGEAPTDTPESIGTATSTETVVPVSTATPEIVFQIDGSQYLTQADQIPAEEQALWNEASANYQSFFGEEAVKIAYSNMFEGVVALGPEGTIRGYYNKGTDMLLGVEAEGWIKAFGGDQLLMVTSNPTKTRYDFLDSYGKPQSSAKAVEELELMMRAELGVLLLEKNGQNVVVIPEGVANIENYRKDSEFIRQNIDTLPDQYLPLGGNNQMNGLDHPVIMVLDNDIEEVDYQMVGNTVIYRMGKFKPLYEGEIMETTSIDLFVNFYTRIDQKIAGNGRYDGYKSQISDLNYKKNSKIFFRLIFTEK